jgi:hypothetical protein
MLRAGQGEVPCRGFRLGGQKSPWLVSIADLAELIDKRECKQGSFGVSGTALLRSGATLYLLLQPNLDQ